MFGPSRRVARRTSRRVVRRQMAMQGGNDEPEYAEPPPAAPQDDMATKLKQLAELHSTGVLSDEEFAAAKAKLLGT
jgi:putative oligomerization/nucleic acid binding protein